MPTQDRQCLYQGAKTGVSYNVSIVYTYKKNLRFFLTFLLRKKFAKSPGLLIRWSLIIRSHIQFDTSSMHLITFGHDRLKRNTRSEETFYHCAIFNEQPIKNSGLFLIFP